MVVDEATIHDRYLHALQDMIIAADHVLAGVYSEEWTPETWTVIYNRLATSINNARLLIDSREDDPAKRAPL